MSDINWGPTGEVVYQRTYSRKHPHGGNETWPETVQRVATGNLALVHGDPGEWPDAAWAEYTRLTSLMLDFKILPAGRHLWASGVEGRQFLFNCHVSGWGAKLSTHFDFTFVRLLEGGGVGANYSSRFLASYGAPRRELTVHIVCDPAHPDYAEMREAGVLSERFDADWPGAFPVEDSREGWAAAVVDLIDTFMTDDTVIDADRVYDVSRVRARGARLATLGGTASGPAPFARTMRRIGEVMNGARGEIVSVVGDEWRRCRSAHLTPIEAMAIDHAIDECVVSGGVRRSARMAICHWNDPHVHEFITCKADTGEHWTTNISVEIDTAYLAALADGDPHARAVHMAVVRGMLTNGEPGFWNSSYTNTGEIGEVIATNPCGEIGLEAWEACNLSHVNLDAFAPTAERSRADVLGLIEAHRLVTRFVLRATFGDITDPQQRQVQDRNRRIGVGHLGVQSFFAKRGQRYSTVPRDPANRRFLRELAEVVRDEARHYALALGIPEPVKVTTVAPTGSIAKLPGVTEGIQPIYARYFIRRVRFNRNDPDQFAKLVEVAGQGHTIETCVYDASGDTMVVEFPTMEKLVTEVVALGYEAEIVESADEIALADMLAFQEMYQSCYADNAVSFTVNTPQRELTESYLAEVADTLASYLPHLKGTTLMVDGTRPQSPYERITEDAYLAATVQSVADGTDADCATGGCPVR
ncbi:ribonucleoside-triphosphate reductase, adenosylcobalamin-dependent [Geodermatophilus maliterrae]|uniref:Adenosylcobalamin-dependent ribonucleoside-triphosphate reductase n=1 Tax=Geodermatophilus maliterrae TaxID=3162531 RepID=A0ABV3XA31_9ACTN